VVLSSVVAKPGGHPGDLNTDFGEISTSKTTLSDSDEGKNKWNKPALDLATKH
jgi:hypothetical protein